jgi:hypothetical protein
MSDGHRGDYAFQKCWEAMACMFTAEPLAQRLSNAWQLLGSLQRTHLRDEANPPVVRIEPKTAAAARASDAHSVPPAPQAPLATPTPVARGAFSMAPPAPPTDIRPATSPAEPLTDLPGMMGGAAAPAGPPDYPSNDTEFSLLEQAQRALRDDPRRALDLADHDAQRYPTGTLAQEREVIAIEALAQLGRRDEARARAARFFRAFPGSAHAPRIASLLDFEAGVHNP